MEEERNADEFVKVKEIEKEEVTLMEKEEGTDEGSIDGSAKPDDKEAKHDEDSKAEGLEKEEEDSKEEGDEDRLVKSKDIENKLKRIYFRIIVSLNN